MSQKSEKYNRALGHSVELLWCGLFFQGQRSKEMEDNILRLQSDMEKVSQKEQSDAKLRKAVALLMYEQRCRKRSRQRVYLLIKIAVICAVLIWLSFQIFIS